MNFFKKMIDIEMSFQLLLGGYQPLCIQGAYRLLGASNEFKKVGSVMIMEISQTINDFENNFDRYIEN